ncbi:hypothetical protein NE237_030830 [Protea cynaroides]|uniref:Uncharacterized protein n=1 Tax=Protea cynaroides TaxID=273540 RepID=A0A9Q0GUG4_9MAGN|nr:hypothetical protein NE237_030830 [Protea cynaroides]
MVRYFWKLERRHLVETMLLQQNGGPAPALAECLPASDGDVGIPSYLVVSGKPAPIQSGGSVHSCTNLPIPSPASVSAIDPHGRASPKTIPTPPVPLINSFAALMIY